MSMYRREDSINLNRSAPKAVIDCALDRDALFTPQVAPLTLPDGTVPSDEKGNALFRTIYREKSDGTQVLLNPAVGGNYHADSYKVLYETADALFPNSCTDFKLIGNGEKVMFNQTLEQEGDLGGGDFVHNHLMYTGSLNSTWATAIYGFAFRPMCSNQIPQGMIQLSQKRTKNHDALLFEKATVLAKSAEVFDRFISDARLLKAISLNRVSYIRMRDLILPTLDEDAHGRAVKFADKRVEAIDYFYQEEVDRVGENAWALFNAFQSYEFHTATKAKAEKQIEVVREPAKRQVLTNAFKEYALAS